MKKFLLLMIFFTFIPVEIFAEGKITQIIKTIDDQIELGSDFTATVSLTQKKVTPTSRRRLYFI